MEIKYTIYLKEKVISNDIPKLSNTDKKNISKAINKKLATKPEIFSKPLRNSLSGYRSLRVGNYRIIFIIIKKDCNILLIDHRKKVYNNLLKRI